MRRSIATLLTVTALCLLPPQALANPTPPARPRLTAPRSPEEWKQLPPEQRLAIVKQGLTMAKTQAERWERIHRASRSRRKEKGPAEERRLVTLHLELIELKLKAARKQVDVMNQMVKMVEKNPEANLFLGLRP